MASPALGRDRSPPTLGPCWGAGFPASPRGQRAPSMGVEFQAGAPPPPASLQRVCQPRCVPVLLCRRREVSGLGAPSQENLVSDFLRIRRLSW